MFSPLQRLGSVIVACACLAASLAFLSGCGKEEAQSTGGADGTRADTPQTTVQRHDKSLK
jgi:hypothetical protein